MEDLAPARRRMILALVISAPMLVAMLPGSGWHLPGWLQASLATPVERSRCAAGDGRIGRPVDKDG